jgi:hypothetical protein
MEYIWYKFPTNGYAILIFIVQISKVPSEWRTCVHSFFVMCKYSNWLVDLILTIKVFFIKCTFDNVLLIIEQMKLISQVHLTHPIAAVEEVWGIKLIIWLKVCYDFEGNKNEACLSTSFILFCFLSVMCNDEWRRWCLLSNVGMMKKQYWR